MPPRRRPPLPEWLHDIGSLLLFQVVVVAAFGLCLFLPGSLHVRIGVPLAFVATYIALSIRAATRREKLRTDEAERLRQLKAFEDEHGFTGSGFEVG